MLVIISGRSGSGKSVALRALEDMGFYCVDNLPTSLLPELLKTFTNPDKPIAVSIDIRNLPNNSDLLDNALNTLPKNVNPLLLFLDSDRQALIRRYSDTRRLHPLSVNHLSLEDAIDKENELLNSLRMKADLVIDTTNMSVHELAETLREKLLNKKNRDLTMVFKSFGFKNGLPPDSDYVFDVRFLPNPHWVPELRPQTGLDDGVITFLSHHNDVANFIYQTYHYLEEWLPALESNNRSYLTIAIGCTGGQHRSVYITEQLANYFRSRGKNVQVQHRELTKKGLY